MGIRFVDVSTVIVLGHWIVSKECKCGLTVVAIPSIMEAECSWVWLWFRDRVLFPTVVCMLGPGWLILLSIPLDVVLCTDSSADGNTRFEENKSQYLVNYMYIHTYVHVQQVL